MYQKAAPDTSKDIPNYFNPINKQTLDTNNFHFQKIIEALDEESSDSLCDGREDPEDQHWEQEEEDDELEDSLDEIQDSLEEGDEDYESDDEHKPILGKNM